MCNKLVELSNAPIDLQRVLATVTDAKAGGQVLFVGTTRSWTACRKHDDLAEGVCTAFLIYEAHESMAIKQIEALIEQAAKLWPLLGVAIVHRLGKVLPAEPSIAIAVSAPHRREAYEASQWLIDTVKRDVPIWKQEHYQGGQTEWIHPQEANCSASPDIEPVSQGLKLLP